MNSRSESDDRDRELFFTKLEEADRPEACAGVFGDLEKEVAVFRDAAIRVRFATNLYHQTQGHRCMPCICGCDEEECVAGIAASTAFAEEVDRSLWRAPEPGE